MTSPTRFRFAPSPTGHLHIGGARTALYNWLMAKKNGGTFVLRVEDTDRERSTQEYVDSILDAMRWLGLDWQEGPFFQTARFEVYREHVQKLVESNRAYRCYCTAEELEAKRAQAMTEGRKPKYDGKCRRLDPRVWSEQSKPYCIRFKAPEGGSTVVDDLIRGKIEFQNQEMDDLIIWRSDDTPTYNLSVVVDDVTMQITHVIRGDDHLNNTPRQILLYQALDYPTPQFAHVPMILGSDKARLSKRHGATSVLAYREMGYLPEALLNYLVRLGWAFGDQEIFTREELIQSFTIEAVGKSPSVFNPEKLLWLNGLYIRQSKPEVLLPEIKRLMFQQNLDVSNEAKILKAIQATQEKEKTLLDMIKLFEFAFVESVTMTPEAQVLLQDSKALSQLRPLLEALQSVDVFEKPQLQIVFDAVLQQLGIKLKELAQPTRAALVGKTISPGIYEVLELLGKEKVIQRLQKVLS